MAITPESISRATRYCQLTSVCSRKTTEVMMVTSSDLANTLKNTIIKLECHGN